MLPEGEAHLFILPSAAQISSELIGRYLQLLAADERARYAAYRFDEGRREYLSARALIRVVLSRYADVAPSDWRFSANEYGRPEIAPGIIDGELRFNLSHSQGTVACLVVDRLDAGVDVETEATVEDPMPLAERFFSSSEAEALGALPRSQRQQRFLAHWTLKEAYVKARGRGLTIPLKSFSCRFDANAVEVAFEPGVDDRAEDWQLGVGYLGRRTLACAIRRGAQPDLRIVTRSLVPLASEQGCEIDWEWRSRPG